VGPDLDHESGIYMGVLVREAVHGAGARARVWVQVQAVLLQARVLFEKSAKFKRAYFCTVGGNLAPSEAIFALVAAMLHRQIEPSETGPTSNFCPPGRHQPSNRGENGSSSCLAQEKHCTMDAHPPDFQTLCNRLRDPEAGRRGELQCERCQVIPTWHRICEVCCQMGTLPDSGILSRPESGRQTACQRAAQARTANDI